MVDPGLVVVDKSPGMTSHDVVARVRRLAGTRKVGHAGTLDPMATGVLVLGVDRATRLLGHLMLTEKAYDATIRLGAVDHDRRRRGRGRLDPRRRRRARGRRTHGAGAVRRRHRAGADRRLRHQGRRPACLRPGAGGRAGRAQGAAGDDPRAGGARGRRCPDVRISVRCSSGTYIRAIARDLGAALGVGGHLSALRRTAVGSFDLSVARTLDELADDFAVLPIARRGAGDRSRSSTSATRRRRTYASAAPSTSTLGGAGPHAVFAPGRRVPRPLRAARARRPGRWQSSSNDGSALGVDARSGPATIPGGARAAAGASWAAGPGGRTGRLWVRGGISVRPTHLSTRRRPGPAGRRAHRRDRRRPSVDSGSSGIGRGQHHGAHNVVHAGDHPARASTSSG